MVDTNSELDEPKNERPQVVNISEAHADQINADMVRMQRSATNNLSADEVEMHQSAAQSLVANKVIAHESGLAVVKASEVDVHHGSIALAKTDQIRLNGKSGLVISGSAELQGSTGVLVGQNVQASNVRTGIMIARHVDGDVETIMDTRTSLIIGMFGGMVAAAIILISKYLSRSDS